MLLMWLTGSSHPAEQCSGFHAGPVIPIASEADAVAIARGAMSARFTPEVVNKFEPYVGSLVNGVWHVHGSLPEGFMGGTPEAVVCHANGEVLTVVQGQ